MRLFLCREITIEMEPVLKSEGFQVYIYEEDEHPPPHCHVIFSNGDQVVVGLPFLNLMYGGRLKRSEKKFLKKNINKLCDDWEQKHPLTR